MFEKYTEKARRAIFFARYEVSQLGGQSIETEHLLLGLLREDKALFSRLLPASATAEEIRRQLEERTTVGEKIPTSAEVPLSSEVEEALKFAAEESTNLARRHVGTEHLLLGLLRTSDTTAEKVLRENDVTLSAVRQLIGRDTEDE